MPPLHKHTHTVCTLAGCGVEKLSQAGTKSCCAIEVQCFRSVDRGVKPHGQDPESVPLKSSATSSCCSYSSSSCSCSPEAHGTPIEGGESGEPPAPPCHLLQDSTAPFPKRRTPSSRVELLESGREGSAGMIWSGDPEVGGGGGWQGGCRGGEGSGSRDIKGFWKSV